MPEYTVEEFERMFNDDMIKIDELDVEEVVITEEEKQRYTKTMLEGMVLGQALMLYDAKYYHPARKKIETILNSRQRELCKMYLYKDRQRFIKELSGLSDRKTEL